MKYVDNDGMLWSRFSVLLSEQNLTQSAFQRYGLTDYCCLVKLSFLGSKAELFLSALDCFIMQQF